MRLTCHFCTAEPGSLPNQILIGPRDMNKWRAAVVFRGEIHKELTMQDRAEIAADMARVINQRLMAKKSGIIIAPGVVSPVNVTKGHKE